MLVCVDIDGTIDAFPYELGELMQALRAAGNEVHVLTGVDDTEVDDDDLAQKADYLMALGVGNMYDELVIVPNPHPENKASYMREKGADILIDNNKGNADAAADICPVLVPWQSRVKRGSMA